MSCFGLIITNIFFISLSYGVTRYSNQKIQVKLFKESSLLRTWGILLNVPICALKLKYI